MPTKIEKYNAAFTELSEALRTFDRVAKRLGFPVSTVRYTHAGNHQRLTVRTRRA